MKMKQYAFAVKVYLTNETNAVTHNVETSFYQAL
jgi:hypothetical protein